MLQIRGVHYDVGHEYKGEGPGTTRLHFERGRVEADMAMIADQLHANTVRVAGTDLSRITTAAGLAREAGLSVWFSPFPGDLAGDEVVSYLGEAASMAEGIRSASGSVAMVAGCEMSLFCAGFLPGETLADRLAALISAAPSIDLPARFRELPQLLNATLSQSVTAIRDRFHGPVTYASAPWEAVDWTPFDVVSVDLYRDSSNAVGYRDSVRSYTRFGKPLVVTEFGCCTYKGAANAGGLGFAVLEYDAEVPGWRLKASDLERSEAEQSRYLTELLTIFGEEAVHGAFWHTFAGWMFPHRSGPCADLDLGSFGLVKLLEAPVGGAKLTVELKEAFRALAAAYQHNGRE